VTDQLERVKVALADRCEIKGVIGHGGMATVYLAEDLKHRRQVAVKVLRPDLAAALGAERFLREIEIAAQLEHPHILTLIDSGEADDFLYFIMPYVKGESLRAKLAKERELPISEAARILSDVVDALAHAHAHGVVHRDIKPDNVLLSGHHAVVTDFGVAKAVSEAQARTQITTAGLALGTPAYMSPEQAAGDPSIDHRADIYSVGAVAYELLTGRPPFSGDTSQQVLAAHVTETPDPVTKYRSTVPEGLAELVMRCLAKKPADRWQSAEELLPQLAAYTTPSGGTTPTGTRPAEPVIAIDLATLLKRAGSGRLLRVTVMYLVASVAVLAGVQLTASLFGLPGWFLPVGIVLLLIGLPIILTTAAMHQARGPTAGTGTAPPWRAPHHWLTWRRALLGGVLAFSGLGSIGAGVVWLRNRGHELHDDAVAVMPFHVVGNDLELWREGLVDLMRTALDGTGRYRASDPRAVLNTWRRSLGDAAELPEPDKAADVARSLDAGHLVLGSVIRTGPGAIRVAADLYSTRWLRREGSATVEGDEGEMTSLIDRMTVELLKSVWRGEGLPDVRVSAITTQSIPALKAYLEGEQAFRRSQFETAQQAFARAVDADSTFAMALHRLALSYGWSINIFAEQLSRYELAAVRHSGGLPERDSLSILGSKLIDVDGDLAAIQVYQDLSVRYPDDLEAWYGLGEAYFHLGAQLGHPPTSAIAPFEQALALDSSFAPALIHLIEIAHSLGDSVRAVDWTNAYLAIDSTSRFATAFRIGTALRFGGARDSSTAVAALDTADQRAFAILGGTLASDWDLPLSDVVVGAGASQRFSDGTRGGALVGSGLQYFKRGKVQGAVERVRRGYALNPNIFLGFTSMSYARMLDLAADSASRQLYNRLASAFDLPAGRFPWQPWEYGVVAVRDGRLDDARAAAARLEFMGDSLASAGDSATARTARGLGWTIRGHIAAAADSVDTAIAHLRRGLSTVNGTWTWPRDVSRYVLATLLETRGAEEEALSIYGSLYYTPWLEPLAYNRRAQLHERRGEREAALDYYGRFVELWAEADPHLQPQVRAARQAMERLAEN
jgi:tetratricopeptide (TPR) repeat protein/tRNA A-37 threonylcarbamoyl transferase component Bud32